ncbi:MAG TPA: efflux RND transporter periplasmic adaptor subunit [Bryobacteraceae bacterium]|nr:efflux RND transporter periplasmic adaptor subunit [Bryobacteraceae bacterium]
MKRFSKKFVVGMLVALLAVVAIYLVSPSNSTTPPPADEHAEERKDGVRTVQLSDAKIEAAGIELATTGSGEIRETLRLHGILQPNQESLVQVTPRFPGIVREVSRRIGDEVAKGDLLARIESNASLTTYELRAPISGTVIDRQAALGEYVSEQKPSFVIADLGTVWADFSVYRRDLGRLRIGNTIIINAEDGGAPIETKVSYVAPVGNSETQSALARAVVSNTTQRLRPGLFVTGRVLLAAKPVGLIIKPSALQTVAERTVVFVRAGDKFEVREVEIGDRDPESIEIKSGLSHGDIYAAKNSFVIKAELAKGEGGHEH